MGAQASTSTRAVRDMQASPAEKRVIDAMCEVISVWRLERVYPYQLVVFTDVGYSEQHLRRIMRRMAQANIIQRVGGYNSRRGYALIA